jgi:hypothetical protein
MDDRELRLECLKAASVLTRDSSEVLAIARQFYEWLTTPNLAPPQENCRGP